MEKKLWKIKCKFNIITIFKYIPIDKGLKITLYNKELQKLLGYNISILPDLIKLRKIKNPSYDKIKKYIPYFTNIKNQEKENNNNNNTILNRQVFVDENIFFNIINSMDNNNILINIQNKYWKYFFKNINNITLEINPSIIYNIDNMPEKERKEKLEYLNKYKHNIKEIYFNSFNEKNEISFNMREKIKLLLKIIFKSNDKRDHNCYIKKISFSNNSITSLFDIKYLFMEIYDILYNNSKYYEIKELYIDSRTIKNDITNINAFIQLKLPNLQYIELNDFNFANNNSTSLISKTFENLKFLEKVDLSKSVCYNDDIINIFSSNNLQLKELRFKIIYEDKIINWNFLGKFVDSLDVLEIEMDFPDFASYLFKINDKCDNCLDLFLIINRMTKLKKLKLIGELLNNYYIIFLQNNNISNFTYSFYIINPDLSKNYTQSKEIPSITNLFINNNKMNEISLIYNYYHKNELINKYSGIDLLCEYFKEKAYKSMIFIFPLNLSILKLTHFVDKLFMELYLMPLLNLNKEKLSNIIELELNHCFIDKLQFEKFLSLLSLMNNLRVLRINNIILYEQFKMINLINHISTIFKKAPNLIELDLSNNKYKEKIFVSKNFMNISKNLPDNLINLKVFNKQIPISEKTFKIVK